MKITVTYHDRKEEEYTSNRVTFPAAHPYVIIGAFPKLSGKSKEIFLPDIKEFVIEDTRETGQ